MAAVSSEPGVICFRFPPAPSTPPYIYGIAAASPSGGEHDVTAVIAGNGIEGRNVVVEDRQAIAAIGVHLKDAVFLLGEKLAIGGPAKPAGGRAAADGNRLSGLLAVVGRGLQRADELGLDGGDGFAVRGKADDRIVAGVVGDGPVDSLRIGNQADLIAVEIRFAAAGDH